MNKHTPEPWKLSGTENIVAGGNYVVALDCRPEDARRIVACVNACDGIQTTDLEVDTPTFVKMLQERNTLTRQRDELLAALDLYEQALQASWPEGAMGDAFDYWNSARAAIASVKESK